MFPQGYLVRSGPGVVRAKYPESEYGMAYIIKNSRGETLVTLETGTEDTTTTSLTLLGAGFPSYGLQQNENYVYLLENFANASPPVSPLQGQLWYNTSTDVTYQRTVANTWVALASQNYVEAQKVSPAFTGVPTAPTAVLGTQTQQLATTAFVANTIAAGAFAPQASPVLTGIPEAPTAANNTATTQIATTEYVTNLFNDTVLSPWALKNNTLLTGVPQAPTAANAVISDQIATTAFVHNYVNDPALTLYATKASPVLTGVPQAPTANTGTNTGQIATTAFVQNTLATVDLSPYATKASPVFTGIPEAPTPLANVSSNQIATTSYVQQQKISPAFTGVPQAPTAATGTNTTQIATTEFVSTAVGMLNVSTVSELAGSIKMWASATPPDNWALCSGQSLNKNVYPTLFSRIGYTYGGSGDTFNLPNFINKFPVGAGGTYANGSTGGYADAAVISHTHAASASSQASDSGHFHYAFVRAVPLTDSPGAFNYTNFPNQSATYTFDTTGRHSYTLGGMNGRPGFGNSPSANIAATSYAQGTTSVSTTVSIGAPAGSVSGTGRNLPPYIAAYWIIKISDDGSGGGTLQAGSGIDITTAGPYSTIINTGVRTLTAGTGISITGANGVLTVTNTGSVPTLVGGIGINIAQVGQTYTITNTVSAIPVIAGAGISVTNTPAGAIVSSQIAAIQAGPGIDIINNAGTYTISARTPSAGVTAWATCTVTGSTINVQGSYNLTAQPVTGSTFNFTFVTPVTSTAYAVMNTAGVQATNKTTSGFTLNLASVTALDISVFGP